MERKYCAEIRISRNNYSILVTGLAENILVGSILQIIVSDVDGVVAILR